MKKLKLLLLPLLIVTLTACNKTPEEPLKEAWNKTNELRNGHLEYQMDMGMKSNGIEVTIPLTISMDIDEDKGIASMDMTMSVLGMKMTFTSFKDMKNNISYTKSPGTDYWMKTKNEENSDNILDFNYTDIKKIEEKDGLLHYQITISKNDLEQLFSTIELEDTLENNEFHFSKDVTADVYIDKKSSYISKIDMDLTDTITLQNSDCNDGDCIKFEITKLNVSISISEFNNVTVNEIGKDIIDNAIDEEAIEVQGYAEDYIYEVENLAFDEHFKTFTFTDLEYEGPKPELVDLYLEDDYVMEGTMKINGYTITITDGEIGIPTK